MSSYKCFSLEIKDHIAHLEMSRPDALNAMNRVFWRELPEIIRDIDFNLLFYTDLENLVNIDKNLGLDTGNRMQTIIDLFIKHKTGSIHTTFAELFEKTQVNIVIGAVCLNTQTLELFSYTENPDMQIRVALRASCSIPILFSPVLWNGKLYVDGGMIGRYPLQIPQLEESRCGIGFFVQEKQKGTDTESNITFVPYIKKLMMLMFESAQKFEDSHPNIHTVQLRVPLDTFSPLSITTEEKQTIIENGFQETRKKIISLRMNLYNSISSAQERIESCIRKKRLLGARFP